NECINELQAAGLSPNVAQGLDDIFKKELVKFSDLDERALEALKELDEEGALAVLKQFNESNLQHVHNKSAFLCGVIKIHRQRCKEELAGHINGDSKKTGPNEDKIQELLERTNYSLDVTTGQRRYGGPPPKDVYDGVEPGTGCQVFVGRIPRFVFEDELVPLLEEAGVIWDFRLMMDPMSGQNRGYGFVTYTDKDAATECVKMVSFFVTHAVFLEYPSPQLPFLNSIYKLVTQTTQPCNHSLDNYEIRPKKFLGVCVSQSNCRLFVGSIPKTKSKDEIFEEFDGITQGLKDVIIYLQTEDKMKNRGFCFLEYTDHKAASQARRRLSSVKVKAFNNTVSVDWADPVEEPSDEIMAKVVNLTSPPFSTSQVKVLYVKNLSMKATEEIVMATFSAYGEVERVKKIKDYAFVHFKERENALKALSELNGLNLEGEPIEISLAKPVDKKKKERQMERKMMTHAFGMAGFGGRGGYNMRGRGRGMYGGQIPPMGFAYGDDYFTGDYMGYGYYDDPFF
uniref:RRM domain-containing protein n=1 Tax=Ciona savignyi TaxID=51511 RepID=H2ZBZ6_CIOSA